MRQHQCVVRRSFGLRSRCRHRPLQSGCRKHGAGCGHDICLQHCPRVEHREGGGRQWATYLLGRSGHAPDLQCRAGNRISGRFSCAGGRRRRRLFAARQARYFVHGQSGRVSRRAGTHGVWAPSPSRAGGRGSRRVLIQSDPRQ